MYVRLRMGILCLVIPVASESEILKAVRLGNVILITLGYVVRSIRSKISVAFA